MPAPDIQMIDPETLRGWLVRGEAVLYDVRERHEWDEARIDGATLMPLSQFDAARIETPEGKKLVFHCRSGVRCGAAAGQMALAGAQGPIYRLQGGIIAWAQAGLPFLRGQE
ncbi:rhodanese-like domain-containing protein [Oceanibaculum pacificum]|uniref:Sulfurtransferase n=1 Tax=Oceanibaculum pacificum TaxID=580166 RepID=A0A154WFN8_9PROT|nr:rhodanese-like domain-containing protein [Oceanibaculum pacificum]KZD12330.1 sulfurtransferase [Oceanibaculum pacificum]